MSDAAAAQTHTSERRSATHSGWVTGGHADGLSPDQELAAVGPAAVSVLEHLAGPGAPDRRTEYVLQLQHLHGNHQVARMIDAARHRDDARASVMSTPSVAPGVSRAADTGQPTFTETAGDYVASAKTGMYDWVIDKLRGAQRERIAQLRSLTASLGPDSRALADKIVDGIETCEDILISLVLAVLSLVVGFVSGVVKLVWGLLTAIEGLFEGIMTFIAGFFSQEYRDRFDEWARGVSNAIANLPTALKALIDRWLAEFKAADTDHKTIMIGELTGEVLALIASFLVGGEFADAGSAGATARAPAFAMAGGGTMARGAAIAVPAMGPPLVAGGLATAMASNVNESGGGPDKGSTTQQTPENTQAPQSAPPAAESASTGPPLKPYENVSRFKRHVIDHIDLLEKAIGRKINKWSVDQGQQFVQELENLRSSGELKYVGKGTLAKGQPTAFIYRGRGLTLVQRESGEFWTLLQSGSGKDLAIQITKPAVGVAAP